MGGGDGEKSGDWKRYVPEGGGYHQPNFLQRWINRWYTMLDGPVTWFRGKFTTFACDYLLPVPPYGRLRCSNVVGGAAIQGFDYSLQRVSWNRIKRTTTGITGSIVVSQHLTNAISTIPSASMKLILSISETAQLTLKLLIFCGCEWMLAWRKLIQICHPVKGSRRIYF